MAKQVCDLRASAGMTRGQSTEHLRAYKNTDPDAKKYGYYDPSRSDLNFEVTKGGVVTPVNKRYSLDRRFRDNLKRRGIEDPNVKKRHEGKLPNRRTLANIILGGSRERMLQLAFGNQKVDLTKNADNRGLQRKEEIEKWAVEMYNFIAKKYGEENILAFIVHLDEKNPHVHCSLIPVNNKNRISYKQVFAGPNKDAARNKFLELHNSISEINRKWDLERGEDIQVTGAKHRTTEQYFLWLHEQCNSMEKTMEGLYKQITFLKEQIRKTEIKEKSFTTMINNKQQFLNQLQSELDKMEIDVMESTVEYNELEKKRRLLEKQVEGAKEILKSKQEALRETDKQLGILKDKLEETHQQYNEMLNKQQTQRQEIARNEDELEYNARREVFENIGKYFVFIAKRLSDNLDHFRHLLPPETRKVLDNILDETFIKDFADHGGRIIDTATNIFLGFLEQAVNIAQSGGGVGGSASDFRKKDSEDEEAYKYRCFAMACMICRPRRINQIKYKR